MLDNTLLQTYEVEIKSDKERKSFDFKVPVNMAKVYGIAFGIANSERANNTTFGLRLGNRQIVDPNANVDVKAFAFSDSVTIDSAFLPINVDCAGESVIGAIEDGGMQQTFLTYKVKIYLLGLKSVDVKG